MFLGELFLYLTWPALLLVGYISVQLAVQSFERHLEKDEK